MPLDAPGDHDLIPHSPPLEAHELTIRFGDLVANDAVSLTLRAGWLTGSEWNWGPMYTDIVTTALEGTFEGSQYDGDYRVGLQTGDNPFVQSPFGPSVTDETKAAIETAKAGLADTGIFTGPLKGQGGDVVVPAGKTLTYDEVEQMNFLVEGVVGNIPK